MNSLLKQNLNVDIVSFSESNKDTKEWWDKTIEEKESKGRIETPNSSSKIICSIKPSNKINQTFTLSQFTMPMPKVPWKIKQFRKPFQATNEVANPFRKMVSN